MTAALRCAHTYSIFHALAFFRLDSEASRRIGMLLGPPIIQEITIHSLTDEHFRIDKFFALGQNQTDSELS